MTRLAYGKSFIETPHFHGSLDVLEPENDSRQSLTDIEIGERLDRPVDSPTLEDLVENGDRVLLVVPDATRNSGAGAVANLVVRRLIASGIEPYNMAAIFATGTHRSVTEEEGKEILTPFLAQRLKTYNHNASDLMKKAGLDSTTFSFKGTTSNGIEIWLNRILDEYDKVVTMGSVGFHYFAGCACGRKTHLTLGYQIQAAGVAQEKTHSGYLPARQCRPAPGAAARPDGLGRINHRRARRIRQHQCATV